MEVSCCKFPEASTLQGFWEDNKKSLTGFVMDQNGQGKLYLSLHEMILVFA